MKTIPANLLTRAAVNDVVSVLQGVASPSTPDGAVLHDLCLELGLTNHNHYWTDTANLKHRSPLHLWFVFDAYMVAFWKFTSHQDTAFMTAIFAWLRDGTYNEVDIMNNVAVSPETAASIAAHMICLKHGHMFRMAESAAIAADPRRIAVWDRSTNPAFVAGLDRARFYRMLADKNLLPTSVPLPF